MARLKNYNGRYCESEYEYAFIGFLEAEGWIYFSGNNISRVTKRDVLIADDFKKFIADYQLGFKAYAQFGKAEIMERTSVLIQLVQLIWNDEMFK